MRSTRQQKKKCFSIFRFDVLLDSTIYILNLKQKMGPTQPYRATTKHFEMFQILK